MSKTLKLRKNPDGEYVVSNSKEASHLFEHFVKVNLDLEVAKLKYGIKELEEDKKKSSKALATFLANNNRKVIKNPEMIGEVVERTKKFWVWDTNDIPDGVEGVKPLRKILKLKFRKKDKYTMVVNAVTKRVIDPEGIQELINEKILSWKDVEPALVTYVDARYINPKPNVKKKEKVDA
jgi:hypothetical protein